MGTVLKDPRKGSAKPVRFAQQFCSQMAPPVPDLASYRDPGTFGEYHFSCAGTETTALLTAEGMLTWRISECAEVDEGVCMRLAKGWTCGASAGAEGPVSGCWRGVTSRSLGRLSASSLAKSAWAGLGNS